MKPTAQHISEPLLTNELTDIENHFSGLPIGGLDGDPINGLAIAPEQFLVGVFEAREMLIQPKTLGLNTNRFIYRTNDYYTIVTVASVPAAKPNSTQVNGDRVT